MPIELAGILRLIWRYVNNGAWHGSRCLNLHPLQIAKSAALSQRVLHPSRTPSESMGQKRLGLVRGVAHALGYDFASVFV